MFCHCHNWVPAQSIREGWPTLDLVEVHFSLPKNVREETCRFKAGENVLISINDPVSTSAARDGRVFNDHEHDNYEILSPDTDFKRKSKERRGRPAGPTQNQPTLASIDVYTCTMEQSIHIVYTEFTLTYMQLNAAGFPPIFTMELQQHLAGGQGTCSVLHQQRSWTWAVIRCHLIHVPAKNPRKKLLPFKSSLQVASPSTFTPLRQICHFFSLLATFKCVCEV